MSYYAPEGMNAPKGPSPWKAILRVIYEPSTLFEEFSGRVPIFPGYLAQMVLGLVSLLLTLPVTLSILDKTMANTPGMTPQLGEFTRWSGIIGGALAVLITPWLSGLVVSLIALFFGQFQEERVPYTSYLGMMSYARLPLVLSALVGAIVTAIAGEKAMGINLSLAAIAPLGGSVIMSSIAASISPFSIWYYWLLAITFGKLHHERPARGAAFALTLYTINLLFIMASTAITSRLAVPGI